MDSDINPIARFQINKQENKQVNESFDCGWFALDNVHFVTCGGAQRPQG